MATKRESTLSPWITGTRVHHKQVDGIAGRGERRRNRDVIYRGGTAERVDIPELQDHLLLNKGYLPKYSGIPLAELLRSQMKAKGVPKKEQQRIIKNAKARQRYWDKKREGNE